MSRAKRSSTSLVASLAAATGLSEGTVDAVLTGLTATIRATLSPPGAGVFIIPGVARIERKTVPACPTWPPSIKVTVDRELLPGPDDRCIRGLHTYFRSPAINDRGHPICGSCGHDDIDWKRLHKRDIGDVEYTVAQLRTDRWQNGWWSGEIDAKAMQHAIRRGWTGIEEAIRRRVFQSVGRVYRMKDGRVQPWRDGSQTTDKVGKMSIIHYGQHATATCCRKCIEVWHGIPRGRELCQKEMDYLAKLLLAYVSFKLPRLRVHPR
jgi:hypothetical protein